MKYFLAHNSVDIFHYSEINENQVITTTQPFLKYFDTLEELKNELSSFGVVYEENNIYIDNSNNLNNTFELFDEDVFDDNVL